MTVHNIFRAAVTTARRPTTMEVFVVFFFLVKPHCRLFVVEMDVYHTARHCACVRVYGGECVINALIKSMTRIYLCAVRIKFTVRIVSNRAIPHCPCTYEQTHKLIHSKTFDKSSSISSSFFFFLTKNIRNQTGFGQCHGDI